MLKKRHSLENPTNGIIEEPKPSSWKLSWKSLLIGQVVKMKFPGSFAMHQKLQWEKTQLEVLYAPGIY